MKTLAHSILNKLQEEYPLPPNVTLTLACFNRQALRGNTGIKNGALANVTRETYHAHIRVGLNNSLSVVVNSVAHEYFHCIQQYVNNEPQRHPALEPAAEYFAKKYTHRFLLNLSNIKVPEGYMDMPLPTKGQYLKGSGLFEYDGMEFSKPATFVNYDSRYNSYCE